MSKTIVEWVSRILWLLGALFALTACVCLMIAFSKTTIEVAYVEGCEYMEGSWWAFSNKMFYSYTFSSLPSNLYRAVGYDTICAFFCFLVAKVLHWFSTKGE
jgi:hypothetical protein